MRGGWKSNLIPNQVLFPCLSLIPLFPSQAQNLKAGHLVLSYFLFIGWSLTVKSRVETSAADGRGGGGGRRGQTQAPAPQGHILRGGVKIWGLGGGVPQNVDQGWSPQGTSVGEDLGTSCKVRGMIPPQRISQFWKWLSTLLDGLWP